MAILRFFFESARKNDKKNYISLIIRLKKNRLSSIYLRFYSFFFSLFRIFDLFLFVFFTQFFRTFSVIKSVIIFTQNIL